jgi:xylan 1,4-beta-xylosidase
MTLTMKCMFSHRTIQVALVLSACLGLVSAQRSPQQKSTVGEASVSSAGAVVPFHTYANPINVDYKFETTYSAIPYREAADPVFVLYRNEYYLFTTNGQGYWHSTDLRNWKHIVADPPAVGASTAPAVMVYKDAMYYVPANFSTKPGIVYKSIDPRVGKWEVFNPKLMVSGWDPDIFPDDDGRVYFYWGCTNSEPIRGVELDPNDRFNPIGHAVDLARSDKEEHGWERRGDYNQMESLPFNEGAWMTKHGGKYYLQYATPGTEFKSYADAVWVSDKPLGPFKPAENNPFSSKPEGYMAGAGHGSTDQDKYGNYWHFASMKLQLRGLERRLGMWPVFFDKDGEMTAYTGFGDYPMIIPEKAITGPEDLFPGWMLLSYNKPGHASSTTDAFPVANAFDENGASYWAATTGKKGEWLSVDLKNESTVYAVQITFVEHTPESTVADASGVNPFIGDGPVPNPPTGPISDLKPGTADSDFLAQFKTPAPKFPPPAADTLYHQYLLEYSNDNKTWKTSVDKRENHTDIPYEYVQLDKPVRARYLKLTNYHIPELPGGTFAIAGFRVFGLDSGPKPARVDQFTVTRQSDRRNVEVSWKESPGAMGYNIRFGTARDKLYHNYIVYSDTSRVIRSLDKTPAYYFAVDSFNESGITKGETVRAVQ